MKQMVKINEIKGAIALTKEYIVKLENYKFYIQKLIALKNGVSLLNADEYYKEMIFNEAFSLINTKLSEARSSQYSMLIDGYIYINETKLMNILNIDRVSDIFNLSTKDFRAIDQAVDILIDFIMAPANSFEDHIDRSIIAQAFIDNYKDTTTMEEINIIEDMYKYMPELFDFYFGGIDAFLSIRDMRKTGDQNEN